jgi:hypothetical protein
MVPGSGDLRAERVEFGGDVVVAGSDDVRFVNNRVVGRLQTSGTGEYHDGGGNVWQ